MNPLIKYNPDYILSNERNTLQSFATLDALNQSVSAHMDTLKAYSCKESIMALLAHISSHSVVILGVSWMSNKTMAEHLKVSVRTIQRSIKELIALKIIKAYQTQDIKRRGQTSNTYVILPVEPLTELKNDNIQPSSHGVSLSKQSLKQPFKKSKDLVNVISDPSNQNEIFCLPTYIPNRFAMYAKLISKNESDIVKLYNKVQLAYSKCALDHSIDAYLDDVIRVLQGVVYKVKYGKIKNIFGYLYKGVLETFDRLFDLELAQLKEVSK
ncbi:helix-turn-helix domain-containing protein [Alkalihalobacillus trypoxylicola]|uniref:Uncharacterized protein n=1 Tax=Alkalihalobacillus trypoxylicola TaxID=519424 RepID=A0A161Q1V4_9BACI|nr:helix-turn-helix domain-containing protein [Alkalihalobacillus trypoxylicola]KYG34931.1 hypothetical protein AZF04_00950 [Alkalihalobacillus trypoxylicola]